MKIQAFIFITSILLLISFVHESEQFGGVFKIPPPAPPVEKRQLNFKPSHLVKMTRTARSICAAARALDCSKRNVDV
ncbi:unnamed protein product [Porites evermanni]|uniref:Uncharacterized protein n=1 Tax=Porites evermanni TaxID=104178 RepID=A0ABN8LIF9_9CNID|nr:unnamed protein product [Porites evermanni]